jgi:hypothetical protein
MSFDYGLLARVLLTLVTLGYGFATILADLNKTHATYVGFGLLALALLWWPGPLALERLYLVALMAAIVYGAFFVAVLTMPVYGGGAYDSNGYKPFAAPVPIIARKWDVNITIFCAQVVLLLAGTASILAAS